MSRFGDVGLSISGFIGVCCLAFNKCQSSSRSIDGSPHVASLCRRQWRAGGREETSPPFQETRTQKQPGDPLFPAPPLVPTCRGCAVPRNLRPVFLLWNGSSGYRNTLWSLQRLGFGSWGLWKVHSHPGSKSHQSRRGQAMEGILPDVFLPMRCRPALGATQRTARSGPLKPSLSKEVAAACFLIHKRGGSKRSVRDLPGGTVVKNLPANAETRVWAPIREDPTCRGATKPVSHNYWACALEPASHNYWAHAPKACAPQQEKPPQWEARAPQQRVAPAHCN